MNERLIARLEAYRDWFLDDGPDPIQSDFADDSTMAELLDEVIVQLKGQKS